MQYSGLGHRQATVSVSGDVTFEGNRLLLGRRQRFARLRNPRLHGGKDEPVVPAKTSPAADRLQQEKRKEVAFGQRARTGTKSNFTATIAAAKVNELPGPCMGGVPAHAAPRTKKLRSGGPLTLDFTLPSCAGSRRSRRPDLKTQTWFPIARLLPLSVLQNLQVGTGCSGGPKSKVRPPRSRVSGIILLVIFPCRMLRCAVPTVSNRCHH